MSTIILEGSDGTGKSTAGVALSQLLHLPYAHQSGPPPDDYSYEENLLSPPRVQDRYHFSELIYGGMLGWKPRSRRSSLADVWACQSFSARSGGVVLVFFHTEESRGRIDLATQPYSRARIEQADMAYRVLTLPDIGYGRCMFPSAHVSMSIIPGVWCVRAFTPVEEIIAKCPPLKEMFDWVTVQR